MANEHGLFWNSQNGDRVYDANDFSEWLKKFYTTGVFNGDLAVTASGGMTVSVSSGYVNIEGKVKFFSTPTTLTIATADGTYERIDTVVAECNYSDREITVKVVTGAYSASPKATAPIRTAAAYQLVLAEIDVPAGATEITQKNITDKRMDSNVCGLVTGTVSQIDFSTVKAQFDSWFEDVKGTLDSDAAGNLKNQIDAANEKIDTLNSIKSETFTTVYDSTYISEESIRVSKSMRVVVVDISFTTSQTVPTWHTSRIAFSPYAAAYEATGIVLGLGTHTPMFVNTVEGRTDIIAATNGTEAVEDTYVGSLVYISK